jgi:hypothetical protein
MWCCMLVAPATQEAEVKGWLQLGVGNKPGRHSDTSSRNK